MESSVVNSKNENETYKNLSTSCNDFTSAFNAEVSSVNSGNIVTSPLSIHMILSHLSHGAESATFDELTKGLCHYDKNSIKKGYQTILNQLKELDNVKLYIANTMYIQKEFELLEEFLTVGKQVYQCDISKIDFKFDVEAANAINNWVKEKTNNKILDLVSSDDFDKDTKLVLINAIYFNGNWMNAFNPKNTKDRVFYVTKEQKKPVATMFNKSKYNYGNLPQLHAKFIEIPYMNTDVVMTIILPNEVDGLSNIHNNFSWEVLAKAARDYNDVELYLPKFKIECTLNLKSILEKLGLNSMFKSNANFSRISDVPLLVKKVLHKAVIDVNEEGTEAAAATAVHLRLRRMIDISVPEQFVIDRPFMFIIEYKPNNLPLFVGSVKDIIANPMSTTNVSQKDEL